MRLVLLAALALVTPSAHAQLQIHAAVAPDTGGDTEGMTRHAVVTAPGLDVWIGEVVLDLPPASITTVGLEMDADGGTALSLWLSDDAGRAFAALTAQSIGEALAVVHDGRVLTAPVVASAIPNGLVMITGLDHAEAERLAETIREANEPRETARPTPPLRFDPAPREPSESEPPPRTAPAPLTPRSPVPDAPASQSSASQAARAFVDAVAERDWRAVSRMLHPQSHRAVRASALSMLEVDRGTVTVLDEGGGETFLAADALGSEPAGRVSDLSDGDLTTLYLAALDRLGTWGAPGPPRQVVGELRDGDRVHVVLRAATVEEGVSDLSVVTLARDGAVWRPLLTQPQGF